MNKSPQGRNGTQHAQPTTSGSTLPSSENQPRAFALSCPYRRGFAPLTSSSPSRCGPRSRCCGSSHWEGLLKNSACRSSGETGRQEKTAGLARSRPNAAHCADEQASSQTAFLWQTGHLKQNALSKHPQGHLKAPHCTRRNQATPPPTKPGFTSPAFQTPPLCSQPPLVSLLLTSAGHSTERPRPFLQLTRGFGGAGPPPPPPPSPSSPAAAR